jgi:hypothetical protein
MERNGNDPEAIAAAARRLAGELEAAATVYR